jgi:hypothetical protein
VPAFQGLEAACGTFEGARKFNLGISTRFEVCQGSLQRPIELVSAGQKHLIVPQLFRSGRSSVVDTDFLLDRSSYTLLY